MGFANFYRGFIKGFSKRAKALMDLTMKCIKWTWTPSCQDTCDTFTDMFTTGPILTHFDDIRPTKLETDASDFALGVVVTGAPYREVNSKVTTAVKLKVEDKDRVNDSQRIKKVKRNMVKLEALLT